MKLKLMSVEGYHYHVFLARTRIQDRRSETETDDDVMRTPMGLAVAWDLHRVSVDELVFSGDYSTPHPVVVGNSIDGSYQEYMDRVTASSEAHNTQSAPHHASEGCADNDNHVHEFIEADHDRIACATFASHQAYAWKLVGSVEETDFVAKSMEDWAENQQGTRHAARLEGAWKASRADADNIGAGKGSMRMFAWQHVFLEFAPRVGHTLQRFWQEGCLLPLSATLE